METNDNGGWLRDRNRKAFGVQQNAFGSAWKEGKVGDIYQDETYYIEPNFQWLERINGSSGRIVGSQNMKSRISGIGLKVTKINGEPIWGRDEKVKWSDLRGNNSWRLKGENEIEGGKRTIHVQRVAYADQKISGSAKSVVDLGQGICMLKLPRDKGNVYLVVGVAALSEGVKEGGKREVKWDDKSGYVNEKWTICEGIKGLVKDGPTIVLDGYGNAGKLIVDNKSMLLIGNKEGRAVSWKRSWDRTENVAVVLGVAVKCSNWKSPTEWRENGYKCKNEDTKSWVNDLNKGSGGTELTFVRGSGVIQLNGNVTWESIGSWKENASAKYTWTNKK